MSREQIDKLEIQLQEEIDSFSKIEEAHDKRMQELQEEIYVMNEQLRSENFKNRKNGVYEGAMYVDVPDGHRLARNGAIIASINYFDGCPFQFQITKLSVRPCIWACVPGLFIEVPIYQQKAFFTPEKIEETFNWVTKQIKDNTLEIHRA